MPKKDLVPALYVASDGVFTFENQGRWDLLGYDIQSHKAREEALGDPRTIATVKKWVNDQLGKNEEAVVIGAREGGYAAVRAASDPRVTAVTIYTSFDPDDPQNSYNGKLAMKDIIETAKSKPGIDATNVITLTNANASFRQTLPEGFVGSTEHRLTPGWQVSTGQLVQVVWHKPVLVTFIDQNRQKRGMRMRRG